MTLRVELDIEPKERLLQQDAVCRFRILNASRSETLNVERPSPGALMPRWVVLPLEEGVEAVSAKAASPFTITNIVPMQPGEALDGAVEFNECLNLTKPGE